MHKLVHHQRNVGEHHYYAIKGSEGIRWCEVEREESIFTTAKRGYPREDFLKVAKARGSGRNGSKERDQRSRNLNRFKRKRSNKICKK
jgi:hypothetical protein